MARIYDMCRQSIMESQAPNTTGRGSKKKKEKGKKKENFCSIIEPARQWLKALIRPMGLNDNAQTAEVGPWYGRKVDKEQGT